MDAQEARELLQRAVDEKGADYVYVPEDGGLGKCQYFHNEGGERVPGCIIGHVLAYKGVTYDTLGGRFLNRMSVTYLASNGTVADLSDTPHSVLSALRAAQDTQDDGATWSEALAAFDKVLSDATVQ